MNLLVGEVIDYSKYKIFKSRVSNTREFLTSDRLPAHPKPGSHYHKISGSEPEVSPRIIYTNHKDS